jgi:hypothetical protein
LALIGIPSRLIIVSRDEHDIRSAFYTPGQESSFVFFKNGYPCRI